MRVTTQNGRVLLQNDVVNAAPVISISELRGLGMESVAYIRAVEVEGEAGFAIHAADGTPMAVTEDRETAINAILQHEMMPVPLH